MARRFRFTLILLLAALGTALAAVAGWRFARASAPVNGPIILISIDTLRADHLPAYGYKQVTTPAIDALAADGVVFERAYAHAPQTLPSHAAMLSGRLPFDTDVRDEPGAVVKPGERLLPQMLGERGFATGGVVSARLLRKESGISQGFDFFDSEFPMPSPDALPEQVRRDGAASELIAEHWLDQQRSRVFLFLHLYEPHAPYTPPRQYASFTPYDSEIAYADEIVGRLVQHLKTRQLYDRSTIMLTSDHGEGLGDHGEREHGVFLYDETIHVPLIVKQAGNERAGRRVADVVQHVDLVPTVLDLAKAPIPGNLRGRSLTPLLDGTSAPRATTVYSEALYASYHFGWSALAALTGPRFRYVNAPLEELYDLEHDRGERQNVAEREPKERQQLRSTLDTMTHAVETVRTPLVDPKDKRAIIDSYRRAVELTSERGWTQAIAVLQDILRREPQLVNVWNDLARVAERIDRFAIALDAYRRVAELTYEPAPMLGAATALLNLNKLDEARREAETAADATDVGAMQAQAHALLARIALARRDQDQARLEAEATGTLDPNVPMTPYVEGRLLYDRGRFAEAWPFFEETLSALAKHPGVRLDDAHYYAGDTLARLERYSEAEFEFGEQLRLVPHHARARAGLAAVYAKTWRSDEAEQAATELIELAPTPESYALAARLWRSLGKPKEADAVRAEGQRALANRGH